MRVCPLLHWKIVSQDKGQRTKDIYQTAGGPSTNYVLRVSSRGLEGVQGSVQSNGSNQLAESSKRFGAIDQSIVQFSDFKTKSKFNLSLNNVNKHNKN